MKRYKSIFKEETKSKVLFKKGDKVKMKKGRYKMMMGTVIEVTPGMKEPMLIPTYYAVEFLDKSSKGINTYTDVTEFEIEKI